MRRTFLQTIAYLVLIPGLALAGQISGRLTVDAHPVQEGVKVAVICGDSIKGSTTDRFGSYRLYQPITGECTPRSTSAPNPLLRRWRPTRIPLPSILNWSKTLVTLISFEDVSHE